MSVCQEPRWYPLLSSKYTKQRPALLVTVVLENDSKSTLPSPDRFKVKKALPRQGQLIHHRRFILVFINLLREEQLVLSRLRTSVK